MARRPIRARAIILLAGIVLFVGPRSEAWIRYYAPDDELISRSDSVVVGHLVGPIATVKMGSSPIPNGTAMDLNEFRGRLVVTAVLSGSQPLGETPLIIHYGLRPVRLVPKPSFDEQINPPVVPANDSTSPIGIHDAATTMIGGPPSDDLRQDHVWFLRQKIRSIGGIKEDADAPGIQSPDDVQPLSARPYYEAILKGDPAAIEPFAKGDEWHVRRVREAQARVKVAIICRNPDLSARCDQLIPVWRQEQWSSTGQMALKAIFDCGEIGAQKMVPVVLGPEPLDIRGILQGWSSHNFSGMSTALVTYLGYQRKWWETRNAADKAFAALNGSAAGPKNGDPLGINFDNVYCVVEWLGNSRDPGARGAIMAIREQWKDVPFKTQNNLLKVCDETLVTLH